MNHTKNVAIAAAFGLAAYWLMLPYAEPEFEAPQLTKFEQSTVKLAYKFQDCVKDKLSTVLEEERVSTAKNLIDQGMSGDQAAEREKENLYNWAEEVCVSKLEIDKPGLDIKMDAIKKKTGMGLVL